MFFLQLFYAVLIGLVIPIGIGWLVMYWGYERSSESKSWNGRLGYAFLAGYGLFNLISTVLLINGVGMGYWLVIGFLVLAIGSWIVTRNYYWMEIRKLRVSKVLPAEWILIGLVAATVVFNATWPVLDWDAIALYDFRAKIFAEGMVIEDLGQYVEDESYFRYYYAYPLLTSVAHAWNYLLGVHTPMVIYSGFFASIGLILMDEVKRLFKKRSLFEWFPLMVMLSPTLFGHFSVAYTNLPYAVYLLASLVLIWRGISLKEERPIWLSLLMLVTVVLTRINEPFYLTALGMVSLYLLVKRKWLLLLVYALTVVGIRKIWTDYAVFDDTLSATALPEVFRNFELGFFIEVQQFLIHNYLYTIKMPFFVAGAALLLGIIKRIKFSMYWVAFWLVNGFMLTVGGYFFANQMPFWKDIAGSAQRMMIGFIPILYYWALLVFHRIWMKK